ncbi:hypothetical protein HB364_15120 [Pseudoflavitalea sp. X16]|uniref:hypothetical protein n=1 Tax=Paraflavitalea devenefica TaxID=2716334 RepID=UPI0014231FA7|nr:hypothetical protein [Paraflavitalea devenefica]NII26419.1 hypothetical protein [Paraflavitalea devenefica]
MIIRKDLNLDDRICQRLRILAALKTASLRLGLGLNQLPGKFKGIDKNVIHLMAGMLVVSDSLGLDLPGEYVLPDPEEKNPVKSIFDHFGDKNYLHQAVFDKYGQSYSLVFIVVEITNIIYDLSSIDFKTKSKGRILDKKLMLWFLNELSVLLLNQIIPIKNYFGENLQLIFLKLISLIKNLKQNDQLQEVSDISRELSDSLLPESITIYRRIEILKPLLEKLMLCPVGIKGWKAYEEICFEILNFLFVPPFSEINIQHRNLSGTQRKDALLLNNIYDSGFWNSIRSEFGSKQIVFEFKNVKKIRSQDIGQIYRYLSKTNIGRFGIILTRNAPTKAILEHLREAYHEEQKLIIVIHDAFLKQLMYEIVYFGNCEGALSRFKGSWESIF